MAKITNLGRRDLPLPTRHIVPRMGDLVTTNDTIRSPDNWTMLNAMALAGDVTIELDPDPETIADPVYATDHVDLPPAAIAETPVYATDPVELPPEPIAAPPVYATDPVAEPTPESIPAAEAPVYATDPVPAATPTTEPDQAVTGPVDMPADAITAKAKK